MNASSSATVFHVTDLARSLRYYIDILGFTEDFVFESFYAGVKLGGALIHLSAYKGSPGDERKPPGSGQIYIFCDEVDEYHQTLKSRGAILLSEPQDYTYGMRDFNIEDPDGNILAFGAESKHA